MLKAGTPDRKDDYLVLMNDNEGAYCAPLTFWRYSMAEKKAPKLKRARTSTGAFKSDDPNTPDINEAWEQPPAPKPSGFVWYESREKEPSMFPVAGINPIRNFTSGRLEYKVETSDVERFEQHHFCMNARIVRKA